MLSSLEFHRKEHIEADIFCKFLSEDYDTKDIIFFLYIRSLMEKMLKIKFNKLQQTINSKKIITDIFVRKTADSRLSFLHK
jgi:hypothetical protein